MLYIVVIIIASNPKIVNTQAENRWDRRKKKKKKNQVCQNAL